MGLLTARPSSTHFVVEDPCFLCIKENPDWQSQFGNTHPLKFEIGFGMGDFLISMAKREPGSNFIGIDFSQDGMQKLIIALVLIICVIGTVGSEEKGASEKEEKKTGKSYGKSF